MFVRGGSLVARRLDVNRRALSGDPVTIAAAPVIPRSGSVPVSVAANGLVAYRFEATASHQLQWFDREGNSIGVLGEPTADAQTSVELSPDGRRALTARTVQGKSDIWVVDAVDDTRITDSPGSHRWPLWLHNGYVLFDSERDGFHNLYRKPSDGDGDEELVLRDSDARTVDDVTPDDRLLLFHSGRDLAVLPLDGKGNIRRLFPSGSDGSRSQFSPDGHWMAYQAEENGAIQIFISPFPDADKRWQVSVLGGTIPRWSADGREIYFIDAQGALNAATVGVSGDGPVVALPTPLFRPRSAASSPGNLPQYDVAPDGRFLVNAELEGPPNPISLIVNWRPPQAGK
jgi:hypothetical protein